MVIRQNMEELLPEEYDAVDLTTAPDFPEFRPGKPLLGIRTQDQNWQLFYNFSSERFERKVIAEMQNINIYCCCHGWVVGGEDFSTSYRLIHISSMRTINLPDGPPHFDFCLLDSAPTHPGAHVIFVVEKSLIFWKFGENFFNEVNLDYEGNRIIGAAMNGGRLLCMVDPYYSLLAIEFVRSAIEVTHVRMNSELLIDSPIYTFNGQFFVSCSGDLFFISLMYLDVHTDTAIGLHVYRMDVCSQAWIEVFDIGKNAIFLSPWLSQGFVCNAAKGGVEANTIYFYVTGKNRCVYKYSLEDSLITMIDCCSLVSRHEDFMFEWFIP